MIVQVPDTALSAAGKYIMSVVLVLLVSIETHRKVFCPVLDSEHMIQTNWESWMQNQWCM